MPVFHYDIEQGTDEWFRVRMGIPTASEYDKIITPVTCQLSSQAQDYARLKVAEIMTGEYQGIMKPTFYMERGKLLETEAIEAYEFSEDVKVQKVGFVTDDERKFGCSPDFLVGENGCGENKCLMAKEHLKWLLLDKAKPEHMPQVMGQLLVCEREWCDWNIYHPTMPRHKIRVYRDEKYIKALATALDNFRDIMNDIIEELQRRDMWQVMGERVQFYIAPPPEIIPPEPKPKKARKGKKAATVKEAVVVQPSLEETLGLPPVLEKAFDPAPKPCTCDGSGIVTFTDFDPDTGETFQGEEPCSCQKGK